MFCILIFDEEDWILLFLFLFIVGLVEGIFKSRNLLGVEVGRICVVGMYELLVEVFFIVFGEGLVFLVVGYIFFVSCVGIIFSGCVFESVRFV